MSGGFLLVSSDFSRLFVAIHTLLVLVMAPDEGFAQFGGPEPDPPYELWRIDPDGNGLARLAETPGYTCGSPDWSPDGTLVAYDTWPVGKSYNETKLALIRPDGSGQKIIGDGAMPSWSPDGKQLVCHTYDNPQTIVVMTPDGGGLEKVANHWGSPRWMPRGNRIVSIDTGRDMLLLDLATGTERRILPGNYASQVGFGIASDGLRICFGDIEDGLNLATLDERKMRATVRSLVKGGIARHCSWSHDDKRVAFGWKPNGQELEQIFVFDFEASAATRLPGQDAKRNNACPDWSPEGETIVFVSQQPPTDGDKSPTSGGGGFF
jgi:Tol biopolymer transport system component